MTTQPNTCKDCGKLTSADHIHTCSPQVANTNDADRDAFLTWHRDRFGYTSISAEEVGESSKLFVCWQAALLHARKNVPEWLPIESAPKDGYPILVTNSERGASWIVTYEPVFQSGYRPDNPWQSMMLNCQWHPNTKGSYVPTHWMPLPASPALQSNQGVEG